MHRFVKFFLAGGVFLLPGVLLAQKIQVDYAHGDDFSKYKTYNWVKEPDVESPTNWWNNESSRV